MLLVNADDFGLSGDSTDRAISCYQSFRIHSASAMVFMEDSERAADLAARCGMQVGLHLNLIQPFTLRQIDDTLRQHHQAVTGYLSARKLNQLLFNPFLSTAFEYVFRAQWEEFCRLYGSPPSRLDGHHHMHLCMNMILSRIVPRGLRLRRNFTFGPGQKSWLNRAYRSAIDRHLASRFQCTDSFFSVEPIDAERLRRIVAMSRSSDVELMVHPERDEEYSFLMSGEWKELIGVLNA